MALEDETKKVVLPVWLGVQKSDVRQFSPVMAGRLASIASRGVDVVADDIRKSIQELKRAEELSPLHSFSDQLERLVELSTDFEEQKKLRSESGTGNRAEKAFNEFRRSTRDLFDAMKVKLPKLSLQWWQADEFNVRITAVDCFYLSFHCKEPLRANECVLHLKIGPMEMGESYPMSEWGSEMHFSPTIVAGVVSWVSPQEHATAPPQLAKGWMQKFLDYIQVNLENGRDTPSRDDD